jgi:3-methyladenine DNA glycosylase Tag
MREGDGKERMLKKNKRASMAKGNNRQDFKRQMHDGDYGQGEEDDKLIFESVRFLVDED